MRAELDIVIVASLFERRAAGLYHNTAVVLERDGTLAGRYRKMHIPDDPGFYEKFYFTPGDLGFTPIATSVGDARRAGVLGPVVSGGRPPDGPGRRRDAALPHRHRLGPARRRRRESPPARCLDHRPARPRHGQRPAGGGLQPRRLRTRPGGGPGIQFWGSSFVAGPQGEIAGAGVERRSRRCWWRRSTAGAAKTVRRIWPFLRDRRIDAYDDLLKRYGK